MSEPESPKAGSRFHPVDLLVLLVAVVLGCVAYAYLFRTSPVPRAVDPLLGMVVEVEFAVDRDWKRAFPPEGREVRIEGYLKAETVSAAPVEGGPGERRRVRIRILERNAQMVEAITLFRTGLNRGMTVRLLAGDSEVTGEITDLRGPGESR